MRRIAFVIFVLALGIYLTGCGKKQPAEEAMQPMSMDSLGNMSTETKAPEVKAPEAKTQEAKSASVLEPQAKLEPLPPSGPYKPTTTEVQTALKNAGFYNGKIDGKPGKMTKKAIEDFQKANNLKVDGKIGPKTWAALSKYLTAGAASEAATAAAKKI